MGFKIGFNWWEIFLLVAVALQVYVGVKQHRVRGARVIRRFGFEVISRFSAVFSIVFGGLLFIESNAGIITLLDRCLTPSDSPAWSVILAPAFAMFATFFVYMVFYAVGVLASFLGYYYRKQQQNKSEMTE